MSCCSGVIGPVYLDNYKGEKIDWEVFKKVKYNAFNLMNKEDLSNLPCEGCFFLRSRTENDVVYDKFTLLNLSHWTQCNCGCIYCARMYDSKGEITTKKQKSKSYDMLPVLKGLYKNELLDRENLTVVFQGGDISVLKEFELLVKECLKNGVKKFEILTNNIIYQPIIKKLIDNDKTVLYTSLDCGSRETYKKLKRVDKFEDCVKNLRKYSKSRSNPPIVVKYILVERFNDNNEEITHFLNLMSDIGINIVEFQIDNKYGLFTSLDKFSLPSHYGELYLFFKDECKKRNITMQVWTKTQHTIEKYALAIY